MLSPMRLSSLHATARLGLSLVHKSSVYINNESCNPEKFEQFCLSASPLTEVVDQHENDVEPMLAYGWPSIKNVGLMLRQHCFAVYCLMDGCWVLCDVSMLVNVYCVSRFQE